MKKIQKLIAGLLFAVILVSCGKNSSSKSTSNNLSSTSNFVSNSQISSSSPITPDPTETEVDITAPIQDVVKTIWDATQRAEFAAKFGEGAPVEIFATMIENAGLNKEQSALFIKILELIGTGELEELDIMELVDDFMTAFDGDSLGNIVYSFLSIGVSVSSYRDSSDYYMNVSSKEQALEIINAAQNQSIKDFYQDIYDNFDQYNPWLEVQAYETSNMQQMLLKNIEREPVIYFSRAVMVAVNALYNDGKIEEILDLITTLMTAFEEGTSYTDVMKDLMDIVSVILEKCILTSDSYQILLDSVIQIIRNFMTQISEPGIGTQISLKVKQMLEDILDYMEQNLTGMMLKSISKLMVSALKNITSRDVEHFIALLTGSWDEEQASLYEDYHPTFVLVAQTFTKAVLMLTSNEKNDLFNFIGVINTINNDFLVNLGISDFELHIDFNQFMSGMANFSLYKYDSLTETQIAAIDAWLEDFQEKSIIDGSSISLKDYWIYYDDEVRLGDEIGVGVEEYLKDIDDFRYLDESEFIVSGYSSANVGYHVMTVTIGEYIYKCGYYVYPAEYAGKIFNILTEYSNNTLLFDKDIEYSVVDLLEIYAYVYEYADYLNSSYRETIVFTIKDIIGIDLSTTGKRYAFIQYEDVYQYVEYIVYDAADLIKKAREAYAETVYQNETLEWAIIVVEKKITFGGIDYIVSLDYVNVYLPDLGLIVDTSIPGRYKVEFEYEGMSCLLEYFVEANYEW